MALAIKRVHNLPPHLSYVSMLQYCDLATQLAQSHFCSDTPKPVVFRATRTTDRKTTFQFCVMSGSVET